MASVKKQVRIIKSRYLEGEFIKASASNPKVVTVSIPAEKQNDREFLQAAGYFPLEEPVALKPHYVEKQGGGVPQNAERFAPEKGKGKRPSDGGPV